MNLFELAIAKKINGGGGSEPVIEPLSVTDNGTYSAPSGVDGYSPVTVNVPKGITPSGTISITQNGTVDVTQYASADVNVSGGGGSSYTLITSEEFEVSSTGAQYGDVGTMSIGTEYYQSEKILFVKIRDKAGARSGYYLGSDIIITNANAVDGEAYALGTGDISHRHYEVISSRYSETSQNNKGIYVTKFEKNGGVLTLRYWASSDTVIDGTFKVDVYALDWPNDVSPFEPIV